MYWRCWRPSRPACPRRPRSRPRARTLRHRPRRRPRRPPSNRNQQPLALKRGAQVQREFTLGELAVRFGLGLKGEPGLRISRVATLSHAQAGALSFLANTRYRRQLESTRATAVLLGPEDAASCPVAALIDPNPYLAYARIADLLHPQAPSAAGIHPSAVASASARIAASASIGPLAVIEDGVEIGERAFVGPGCIVQRGAQ